MNQALGRAWIDCGDKERHIWVLIRKLAGKAFLKATGWRIAEEPPPRRFVLVSAPHTSNWDFPYALAILGAMDIKVRWLGKKSLFKFPFGHVMKALGGIPVDRSKHNDLVSFAADLLRNTSDAEGLALLVPAEGTRKYSEFWKSGFIHIAKKAEVPVALGFLDFDRRVGGMTKFLTPTDDHTAFMVAVREFYKDIQGKYPENFGPIQLREEPKSA